MGDKLLVQWVGNDHYTVNVIISFLFFHSHLNVLARKTEFGTFWRHCWYELIVQWVHLVALATSLSLSLSLISAAERMILLHLLCCSLHFPLRSDCVLTPQMTPCPWDTYGIFLILQIHFIVPYFCLVFNPLSVALHSRNVKEGFIWKD